MQQKLYILEKGKKNLYIPEHRRVCGWCDPQCSCFWQSAAKTVRWWCSRTLTPPRIPSLTPPAHRIAATKPSLGKPARHPPKAPPLWRMGTPHPKTRVCVRRDTSVHWIRIQLVRNINSVLTDLVFNSSVASQGENFGILTEEKVIQEVVECVVVTLPETPKVPVEPCPQPLPVPATPPKLPGPSLQAAPQTPASEGKKKPEPPAEVIEVPKSLPADRVEQRRTLVEMCVRILFLCLSRFPQHYKSLYRLAFFYTNSKTHQVSQPCGRGFIITRLCAFVKGWSWCQ